MQTGALIPCRTGSKGIPNKNFKDFLGKPLWKWTFDAALDSTLFDKIIVSSDGGLNELPVEKVIFDNDRPSDLSDDKASLDDLLMYYMRQHPEIDLWCLLQPTSPLRTVEDIKSAHQMMEERETDGDDYRYESLVSVKPHTVFAWIANAVGVPGCADPQPIATYQINKRPNRQDRKDWYLENGAIYFTRKYVLEYMKVRLHGYIGLYVMPEERSIDIDTPLDWDMAEFLGRRNGLA